MQSTNNDRNSENDDISINTNLKVFNGGLGLTKINKKENHIPKISEKNKLNGTSETKDKNSSLKYNKEINIDKDYLMETEGILSFRSKRLNKNESNEEGSELNNITNGIINKIKKTTNKKDNNISNNSFNNNEEMNINKIFKINEERETEKEIKNFEKESQRIQSKILAGNPLESSSSETSEDFEQYDGFNTQKIKRTLDDINFKNFNSGKGSKNVLNELKPINNYNKNYNTISGKELDEKNSKKNLFEFHNDEGNNNQRNIFWNLKGNNDEENVIKLNSFQKRSKSLIEKEFNLGNLFFFNLR